MTSIANQKTHDLIVKLHDKLKSLNIIETRREAMDESFRTELLEYYRPQIEQVELLIGKNLSAWKS